MLFKDKVALITGGSRGIGRAIVLELANSGTCFLLNYLNNEKAANEVKEAAQEKGATVELYQANVGDENEIKKMVSSCVEKFGGLDLVVHSAALGAFKPLMKLRSNQWDLSLDINAKAFYLLAQAAGPHLEKNKGSLLTLSSLGSQKVLENYGAVGISKSALENVVRTLACELGPKGVRVNCISGGPIDTDAIKLFPKYDEMKSECISRTPLGRFGTPEDIAKIIRFLASDDSGWITGQTIVADGGLSLR